MVYVWHASTWQPLIPVFLSLFLSPLLSPLPLPPWPSPTDHVQQSICDDSQRPNCGGEGRAREGKRDSHWCQWEQAKDHQCSSTEHGGTWVNPSLIPRPPTWPGNEAGSTYPHIVHNLLALNPPLHPHTLTSTPTSSHPYTLTLSPSSTPTSSHPHALTLSPPHLPLHILIHSHSNLHTYLFTSSTPSHSHLHTYLFTSSYPHTLTSTPASSHLPHLHTLTGWQGLLTLQASQELHGVHASSTQDRSSEARQLHGESKGQWFHELTQYKRRGLKTKTACGGIGPA